MLKDKYPILAMILIIISYILSKTFNDNGTLIMKIKVITSLILSLASIILLVIYFLRSFFKLKTNDKKNVNKFYLIIIGGLILSLIVLIILKITGLAF
ncbi:hypothetical protein PMY12_08670 [Clostridium tertium]|jgi:hypothetical protein|uniref:hypothetical protein n=1 Tax=Clostridium tertium TaxID=1559 RepID=UPI00232CE0BA|nr:hypothetical protein [Clostridium tertium]MDB1934039.1 hypothetical protein [Clostridium tertium]MDB1937086.1 hypothetical protein [Clostridium tertium]